MERRANLLQNVNLTFTRKRRRLVFQDDDISRARVIRLITLRGSGMQYRCITHLIEKELFERMICDRRTFTLIHLYIFTIF